MNTSNNNGKNKLVRVHFKRCTSTQDEIVRFIDKRNVDFGFSISSDYQSLGRGQRGSSWDSKAGQNLLLSYYFPLTNFFVEDHFQLNICTSLAICTLIESYLPAHSVEIKWPNDIYVNHKKIAGILIQNQIKGKHIKSSIIGIGININSPSRHKNRTCLQSLSSEVIDIAAIREEFDAIMKSIMSKPEISIDRYNERLWKKGQFVDVVENEQRYKLKIIQAKEDGRLEVYTENNTRYLQNKEVKFIIE